MKTLISISRLKDILLYDPTSGVWIWQVSVGRGSCRKYKGDVAGCIRKDGYIVIGIDGRSYLAHQLSWFWMTETWVPEVDHKDRNKSNNAWTNLRSASKSQNQANRDVPRNNTSGKKGISWDGRRKKWRARITVNTKELYLGQHKEKKDAIAAYATASRKYFGEFARP